MYEKLENEEGLYLEGKEGNRDKLSYIKGNIYDEPSKFILSWLGRDSYFNNEKFKLMIEIIKDAFDVLVF